MTSPIPALPEEMMTWVNLLQFPDLPFVPEEVRGGSFAIVMAAYLGDEAEGSELLRPIRDLGPAMDTFAMVPPIELGELAMDPPVPLPYQLEGDLTGDHDHEPLRWSVRDPRRQTLWGQPAPRSWFEEGSVFANQPVRDALFKADVIIAA